MNCTIRAFILQKDEDYALVTVCSYMQPFSKLSSTFQVREKYPDTNWKKGTLLIDGMIGPFTD